MADRTPGPPLQGDTATILSLIRTGAAATRNDLIAKTGLSRSTVSQRLSDLIGRNLVVDAGEVSSTGGRPASLLAFNGSAGVVLAAALGATGHRVGVVDLNGAVLAELEHDHPIADGPKTTLEGVEKEFNQVLEKLGLNKYGVWGIGVGLPGPVEFVSGRPVSPPIMPGWDGFPVADWLADRFGVPVLVDNDVNVMAIGEHVLSWPGTEQLLFVKVGTGIGAGIIADGRLYRGAQGSAGDIGHIYVPDHDDMTCECGNQGCLEAVVGGRAIAARLSADGLPTANAREVVQHVRAGNATAIREVREAGRELGRVLSGLVNVLNPSVLVVGGSLSFAGDHLLASVRETVYRRSPPLATRSLRITVSSAGSRAGMIGAGVMTTQHLLLADAHPPVQSRQSA